MSARLPRLCAPALALALLAAAPARAQQMGDMSESATDSTGSTWLDRIDLSVRYGTFQPTGRSELYALLDRALAPGARPLRPRLVGGAVHLRLTERWGLLAGAERGGSVIASASQVEPEPTPGAVRQRTSLDLTSVQYLGAQWQAYRWRGEAGDTVGQPRLVLRAGGGTASYRLRQWGEFVDAERRIAFRDDFGSARRGTFLFASAALEVPLNRWVALQGELRRQAGSAPMSADYAEFDRLDLGGTMFSMGILVHPAAILGGR